MDEDGEEEDESEGEYAACPIDGCGEVITVAELEDHVELHVAEEGEPAPSCGDHAMFDGAESPRPDEAPRQPASMSFFASPGPAEYQSPYSDVASDSRSRQKRSTQRAAPPDTRESAAAKWRQIFALSLPRKPSRPTQGGTKKARGRLGVR